MDSQRSLEIYYGNQTFSGIMDHLPELSTRILFSQIGGDGKFKANQKKEWNGRLQISGKGKCNDFVSRLSEQVFNAIPRELKDYSQREINVKKSIISKKPETVDEYFGKFPKDIQKLLKEMRRTIKEGAPKSRETISYRMPTFRLNDNLVYFAAFKKHIGFYPTSSGIAAFKKELSKYKTSTGTVQFPFGEPIPYDLVRKIPKFRVKENLERKKEERKI